MRCLQCDYPNPEDHRFCGKCGARLETATSPAWIDERDPLEIEAPVCRSEDRPQLRSREVAQAREKDRERELIRDAVSRNGDSKHRTTSGSTAVENLPHEIIEPTDEDLRPELQRRESTSTGIGGPSFLGLGYESSSNTGFVYDKPRDDGFVYDTDGQTPEYLLEDVPRGISWRAWALFALLLVGAGLGYIQWRASHHQGPDLASILARNGPTVDPSGPVMPDKSAKPAAQKPATPDGNPAAADSAGVTPSAAADQAADKKDENPSSSKDAGAAAIEESGKKQNAPASAASSPKTELAGAAAENEAGAGSESAASDSSDETAATASKPESDAPVAKATQPTRVKPIAETEPAKPKSLGDKDPLIVRAEKYIQGRGVRKSCATGVNLLREAVSAGNPAADIKLGALYWSGTCVTQSKVTAYQWFSRAHSMEPTNRWVERSRSSLWASMNLDERRRASD